VSNIVDHKEMKMNEEAFNISMRKFLKKVGVTSQNEIEKAVARAIENKTISGNETFPAKVTLVVDGLELNIDLTREIRLE